MKRAVIKQKNKDMNAAVADCIMAEARGIVDGYLDREKKIREHEEIHDFLTDNQKEDLRRYRLQNEACDRAKAYILRDGQIATEFIQPVWDHYVRKIPLRDCEAKYGVRYRSIQEYGSMFIRGVAQELALLREDDRTVIEKEIARGPERIENMESWEIMAWAHVLAYKKLEEEEQKFDVSESVWDEDDSLNISVIQGSTKPVVRGLDYIHFMGGDLPYKYEKAVWDHAVNRRDINECADLYDVPVIAIEHYTKVFIRGVAEELGVVTRSSLTRYMDGHIENKRTKELPTFDDPERQRLRNAVEPEYKEYTKEYIKKSMNDDPDKPEEKE